MARRRGLVRGEDAVADDALADRVPARALVRGWYPSASVSAAKSSAVSKGKPRKMSAPTSESRDSMASAERDAGEGGAELGRDVGVHGSSAVGTWVRPERGVNDGEEPAEARSAAARRRT